MPRKATGSVRLRNGAWYARVTLGPNDRPPLALPTCKTEEEALARCAVLSELAAKLRKAGQIEFAKALFEKAAARDGMHRVLSMAVFPARIIAANPLPRGFLPTARSNKALTYLYPSEDGLLMAAEPEAVPLCYRVLYGFLAREGRPPRGDRASLE